MDIKRHNYAIYSLFIIFLALVVLAAAPGQSTPIISEASSANLQVLQDMDGDSEDWIEIHNPGPSDIDLKGYRLSDDFADPCKWEFPERVLPSGEYLVIFASGKNRIGSELHCNFKLKSSGETLRLCDEFGSLLSELDMGEVTVDVSVGFQGASLRYFDEATPGAATTLAPDIWASLLLLSSSRRGDSTAELFKLRSGRRKAISFFGPMMVPFPSWSKRRVARVLL